jgi:hypothetical protein
MKSIRAALPFVVVLGVLASCRSHTIVNAKPKDAPESGPGLAQPPAPDRDHPPKPNRIPDPTPTPITAHPE